MKTIKKSALALCVNAALFTSLSGTAFIAHADEAAAEEGKLETIEVTARKRTENAQEVPASISALQGEKLDTFGSAGLDIRFMNARIPSLAVESSFGRTMPRFYIRGLGNTDFDLNASQPVSLVYDEVVLENPILKGFPVFDLARVEVLRGPQGTLFGRNTPAGLIKFDSKKPTQELDGYVSVGYGSRQTFDVEGAVGVGITDTLSTRVSLLHQRRDDYIDIATPGMEQEDALDGYKDTAVRVQFLYEPTDDFSALLNIHNREMDGTPILFRANIIAPGTNNFAEGYDRNKVYHDSAGRSVQEVSVTGGSLKLEYTAGNYTYTSITGYESAEIFSRADVDGGNANGPGFIPFSAESADGIPDHKQITQELRMTSNFDGNLNYQVGFFYFDEELDIDSYSYNSFANGAQNGYSRQHQETQAWALFTSIDYTISDDWDVTLGLRYSKDEKDFTAERLQGPFGSGTVGPITVTPEDSHVSWDLSTTYKVSDTVNWYARIADSFRAPSIQGRLTFGNEVTVADSETILSFETGFKADILDGAGRVNTSFFYYNMNDQQLTAVGGDANFNRLINADKTVGYGFEVDSEFVVTPDFLVTAGVSYNDTEIQDDTISVAVCAQCTVTNPLNADGRAIIDGNSLPHSPKWIANFTARYSKEYAGGEVFVYTDWAFRSEIDFFLYKSVEFEGKSSFEGGLKVGYAWSAGDNDYEASVFARNITDQERIIGGVDFNNLTGIVNEPRFVGVEFKVSFY